MRKFLPFVAAAVVLVAGCGGSAPPAAPPAPATTDAPAATDAATPTGTPLAQGQLAAPAQATDAFTYDTALAPEGAKVSVYSVPVGTSTRITLAVEGLVPDRGYAAHAHAKACGATGDVAGPHFQDRADPAAGPGKPSVDPAYANPQNEIWLDLQTDGSGNATASTEVPFTFVDDAPASVVIHEAMTTATEPGKAGTAGNRLACLTVPFKS